MKNTKPAAGRYSAWAFPTKTGLCPFTGMEMLCAAREMATHQWNHITEHSGLCRVDTITLRDNSTVRYVKDSIIRIAPERAILTVTMNP